MQHFYETSYANVHRGVYELAERATAGYEGARETVGRFLNAPSPREVVFTRNATEAINVVAYAWGLNNLGPGDVVLVTELEHHSNFVPWQYIAHRTGADFRMLPLDDEGGLRLDALDELAGAGRVKVVAAGMVSNSLGSVNPVEKLAAWAHERGAIMVCDAAQGAPHRVVDVQALGADFVAVTAHKLCGPSGIGALWGRMELLEAMEPFNLGGHMISRVTFEYTSWGAVPAKFEAGTQAIAQAVGSSRGCTRSVRSSLRADERPDVQRGDPRSLQEPARARGDRGRRRRGRGVQPTLRRRSLDLRLVRRGRRDDRGRQVLGARLRDQPGRDLDAGRHGEGSQGNGPRTDAEGRSARGDRHPADADPAQVRPAGARRAEGRTASREGHAAPAGVGRARRARAEVAWPSSMSARSRSCRPGRSRSSSQGRSRSGSTTWTESSTRLRIAARTTTGHSAKGISILRRATRSAPDTAPTSTSGAAGR